MKNKPKSTSTPAHLLLAPNDSVKVLSFMNFNDIGSSTLKDSTAFKKIQYFSKTNPQSLFTSTSDFSLKYQKIADLYLNNSLPNKTPSYGTFRQHNYSALLATTNSFNSLLDPRSLNKFLDYNTDLPQDNTPSPINYDVNTEPRESILKTNSNTSRLQNLTDRNTSRSNRSLNKLLNYPSSTSLINAETDTKRTKNSLARNSFKYLLKKR